MPCLNKPCIGDILFCQTRTQSLFMCFRGERRSGVRLRRKTWVRVRYFVSGIIYYHDFCIICYFLHRIVWLKKINVLTSSKQCGIREFASSHNSKTKKYGCNSKQNLELFWIYIQLQYINNFYQTEACIFIYHIANECRYPQIAVITGFLPVLEHFASGLGKHFRTDSDVNPETWTLNNCKPWE